MLNLSALINWRIKVRDLESKPELSEEEKQKGTIRCTWCGREIYPGDLISAAYLPFGFKAPNFGVIHPEYPKMYIGCMNRDCCNSGIYYAGTLQPNGNILKPTGT